jgi:hypothetical protein
LCGFPFDGCYALLLEKQPEVFSATELTETVDEVSKLSIFHEITEKDLHIEENTLLQDRYKLFYFFCFTFPGTSSF